MEKMYKKRIEYMGELEKISLRVCEDFKLGRFLENKIIPVGYEDVNFSLVTTKGKYVVKVFSSFRNLGDCRRYTNIMKKSMENRVAMPPLLMSGHDYMQCLKVNDTNLRLCVMKFIEGKDMFNAGKYPSIKDIKNIAKQSALINSIRIRPKYVYDSWAIVNLVKEFMEKRKYIKTSDLDLLRSIIRDFKDIHIEKLSHCFVHGDILRTNTIKDRKGKIWILDFAVSNYYPRIVELSVLACDLLFDRKNKDISERNLGLALKEYQKTIVLTDKELDGLKTCIKAAHAMHLIRANYEKVVNHNNSKENEYFLNNGRTGLQQMSD